MIERAEWTRRRIVADMIDMKLLRILFALALRGACGGDNQRKIETD